MRTVSGLAVSLLALLLAACSGSSDPGDGGPVDGGHKDGSQDGDATGDDGGEDAGGWPTGKLAFREVTAEWGIEALAVEGTRIAAVDFDGDGWPDLSACKGVNEPDYWTVPWRHTWLLRNDGQGGFEDVTEACGFREDRDGDPVKGRAGQIVAFADVDNDGDLDAYTGLPKVAGGGHGQTSEIMLNQGDGTFALGPEVNAVRVEGAEEPAGASFVDHDRDGNVDLWVVQYATDDGTLQDRLYQGDGTGAFTDATDAAGLTTWPWATYPIVNQARGHSYGWGALACDLNGDGAPELLASSYGRAPNHLWLATEYAGEVHYTNHSIASGYAFDHRVDWTDNESARCHCKLHPDDDECDGVPVPRIRCESDEDIHRWNHDHDRHPYKLGGNSGSTVCADVDNDGRMDLLTTEIVHWDVGSSSDPSELLINTGEADLRFDRPGNQVTGLVREHVITGWNDGDITAAVFDFDNDGRPDIYIGSTDYEHCKGLLFYQDGPGHFSLVRPEDGIDHNRSHGVAVADFDRDGDLDVAVGHSLMRCEGCDDCFVRGKVRLFENVVGQDNQWLQLSLRGAPGTNALAIGARVTVTAGDITQTQEVGGGHGHYGAQNDLTLHFGLGDADAAEVTVRWPDATLTTETHTLAAASRYLVTQGQEPVVVE